MSGERTYLGDDGGGQAAAAWMAQKHVRAKLLEVIPSSKDEAITVVRIACRAGFTPEAVRQHMVRLRASGAVLRVGCGSGIDPYRYFQPTEQDTETALDEQEADLSTPTEQIREVMSTDSAEALTVAEISEKSGATVQAVNSVVSRLYRSGELARLGAGGRGRPYRYYAVSDDTADETEDDDREVDALEGPDDDIYDNVIVKLQEREGVLEQELADLREAIAAVQRVRASQEAHAA